MGDLLLPKLSISMEEGRLVALARRVRRGGQRGRPGRDRGDGQGRGRGRGAGERPAGDPRRRGRDRARREHDRAHRRQRRAGGAGRGRAPRRSRGNGEASRHGGITAADLAAGSPPAGSFAAVAGAGASPPAAQAAEPVPAAAAAAAAAPADGTGRRFASPAARRRARELGVDLAEVRGRGPGGRVVAADVEEHAPPPARRRRRWPSRPAAPTRPSRRRPPRARPPPARSVAELRPAVVNALVHGWQTIPHVNVGGELDAEGLVAARRAASREPVKVTYTDLLLLALARALRDVPELAGTVGAQGAFQPRDAPRPQPRGRHARRASSRRSSPTCTSLGLAAIAPRARPRRRGRRAAGKLERPRPGARAPARCPTSAPTRSTSSRRCCRARRSRSSRRAASPSASVAQDGLIGVRPRMWANVCLDHRAADGEAGGRLLAALERRIAELPTSI